MSLYAPLLIALGWCVSGLLAAAVLERRGHDAWSVIGLYAAAGPLGFVLLADRIRFLEPEATARSLTPVDERGDGLRVVIPIEAAPHLSTEDVDRFAPERVVVTATIPFEHVGDGWTADEVAAASALEEARDRFVGRPVDMVVLPGRLSDATVEWAARQPHAVILVAPDALPARELARLQRSAAARHIEVAVVADSRAPAAIA
jgi:hypothetical protein